MRPRKMQVLCDAPCTQKENLIQIFAKEFIWEWQASTHFTPARQISPKIISVKCCHLSNFSKEDWCLYFGQEMCSWADRILSGIYDYATHPIRWCLLLLRSMLKDLDQENPFAAFLYFWHLFIVTTIPRLPSSSSLSLGGWVYYGMWSYSSPLLRRSLIVFAFSRVPRK